MPPEVQKLGRTISKWFDKLCNYHLARVSNGPTEALNNLIKRIGFGFRNFENYRIRALLYAGKPNSACAGLDRRPVTRLTPLKPEEPLFHGGSDSRRLRSWHPRTPAFSRASNASIVRRRLRLRWGCS
jgi:hypothetical protein